MDTIQSRRYSENVLPLQIFSYKIYPISELNYWDGLSALKMYSQERRMEKYRIIYTWNILEGIAPNVGIKSYTSTRQGRQYRVPQIKQCTTGKIREIREGSGVKM